MLPRLPNMSASCPQGLSFTASTWYMPEASIILSGPDVLARRFRDTLPTSLLSYLAVIASSTFTLAMIAFFISLLKPGKMICMVDALPERPRAHPLVLHGAFKALPDRTPSNGNGGHWGIFFGRDGGFTKSASRSDRPTACTAATHGLPHESAKTMIRVDR